MWTLGASLSPSVIKAKGWDTGGADGRKQKPVKLGASIAKICRDCTLA